MQARLDRDSVLPLRVAVLRKPAEAAEASRKALREQAVRRGKRLHPHSLVAAEFMMLATSLGSEEVPAGQLFTAYRLRWQIELAFKRLKSLLHIDRLPTRTDRACHSWLYAHLLLAVICDEASQDILAIFP